MISPYTQAASKRAAVDRLIAGERHPFDVFQICSWLRSKVARGSYVEELGHFVHHGEERDKGITFSAASDFFTMADHHQRIHGLNNLTLPDENLRRDYLVSLKKRASQKVLDESNMTREQFEYAIDNLLLFPKDAIEFLWDDSALHFMSSVYGWVISPLLMTQSELSDEYYEALRSEGLIDDGMEERWASAMSFFCACLISVMHLSSLKLKNGKEAHLFLKIPHPDLDEGLSIWIQSDLGAGFLTTTRILQTDLKPADWCSEKLRYFHLKRAPDQDPSMPFWMETIADIPAIEISKDGTLRLSAE